jgi:hypothetical protein
MIMENGQKPGEFTSAPIHLICLGCGLGHTIVYIPVSQHHAKTREIFHIHSSNYLEELAALS